MRGGVSETVRKREAREFACVPAVYSLTGGRGDCHTFIRIGALQTTIGGASALGRVMLAARHLEIPRVYRRCVVFLFLLLLFFSFLHVIKVSST